MKWNWLRWVVRWPCQFWLNKIIANWLVFFPPNSVTEWALLMFDEKMRMCNSMSYDYSPGNMRDFLNYNKLIDVYSSSSRLILDIVFRLNILPLPLSNWQGRVSIIHLFVALLKGSSLQVTDWLMTSYSMTKMILPWRTMRSCLWSQPAGFCLILYINLRMTW